MEDNKPGKGGFLVRVEVKYINDTIGCGVFAVESIPKGTLMWTPSLVLKFTPEQARERMLSMEHEAARVWLRHSFVLMDEPGFLCVNETDDGRYVNHSSSPSSCYASNTEPCVAFRDIEAGEEITVDYSGLGDPTWYQGLCREFDVLTTSEVVRQFSNIN